ncbi:histidine phosphatase family protein [Leucobacter japonicus]|uniref:histidine phosphatase family protein n=1 Tax=Leucobacter japonicus TaxID=1461259 RepID=UPI0006A77310|nr:histidine phosphatase family protein [Leucobacter japonicus]
MSEPAAPAASIVVVRHGETDWNIGRRIQGQTDIPLNERGRAQAGEIAELLAGTGPWTRVIASPLDRARTTADIIAARLGLPQPEIVEDVTERDFGSAEGLLVSDASARWPGLDVDDAEGLDALAQRGASAFARTLREVPGAIVVAHGALIRAALTELSGAPAPRILNGEAWLVAEQADQGSASGARISIDRLGTPAMQHAV